MADEALFGLETLTSQTVDTRTLIRATYESVDIITPWVGATSDNCDLQNLMVSLRAEAKGFVGSVTKSYDNAQSGYQFAKMAESMCKSMLDNTNTNEEVQDLIMEMRGIAQKALNEATDAANSFRANRIGFNNVVACIPETRESINREHGQEKEKKDKVAQEAESWGNKINRIRSRKNKNFVGDLIKMPYVAFAKSRQSSLEGKAQELETKLIKFGDAAKTLRDAEHGLAYLMDKMNILADYWMAMDAVLEDIHDRVQELRISSTLRIKIKCLAIDWNQVGFEYCAYKQELAKLKDIHPTMKAITQSTTRLPSVSRFTLNNLRSSETNSTKPKSDGSIALERASSSSSTNVNGTNSRSNPTVVSTHSPPTKAPPDSDVEARRVDVSRQEGPKVKSVDNSRPIDVSTTQSLAGSQSEVGKGDSPAVKPKPSTTLTSSPKPSSIAPVSNSSHLSDSYSKLGAKTVVPISTSPPPRANSLQEAEHGLAELMDKMSNMADHLLAMDALPDDIHARVQELRPGSTLQIKLKKLAADLNQVGLERDRDLAQLKDLNQTTKVGSPSVPPPIVPLLLESDPLARLADVESCKEINGIVDGAFKALQIIESWREAETNHPQLQLAMQKIQAHSVIYVDAIDMSIKTAQAGYNFSTDAIELCGFLLDKGTDPEDLKEYIADMQNKAKCAHEDSRLTWFKFRDVRRGLIEVSNTISKEAPANSEEGKSLVIRFGSRIGGEDRDVDIGKALEELNEVELHVKTLSDNVDKFAAWWAGMESVLKKVTEDSQDLKPGQNKLRVKLIQKKWTTIREDYQQYKVEIIKLQDHYPSKTTAT